MSIRIALRVLLHSRWHAAATIGTIGLTIALSATVFAVVDGVLFQPLPYPRAANLYLADGQDARGRSGFLSALDVRFLSEADPRILVTPIGTSSLALDPDRPSVSISAGLVGPNFFDVLGMRPLVGGFQPEHFGTPVPGAPRPAILTYRSWRRWLPEQSNPAGHTLDLPGARLVVVGVLPENFVSVFGGINEVVALVPLVTSPEASTDRWARSISDALIRLPVDIPVADATARLNAAMAARASEYPVKKDGSENPYVGVRTTAVSESVGDTQRRSFTIAFLGAMLLVLLGAINVTALTVARAADRAREFGLRAALGASRAALVRLWLVEATTVALVGGVIGVLLAQPLVRVTASLIPWYVQLPKPLEVDWRVAVFAMLAAVLPLALTAIGPAVTASRRAVAANLTVGHRGTSARRPWSRDTLLVAESAIGTTLVLVGSLILAGYMLLRSEDVGFDPERLAIVELARARGETPDVWNPREMRAFDRIRQVPSVRDVAMVGVPFLGRLQQITPTTFAPPDRVGNDSSASRTADGVYELPISGAFFEIAGLRLLEGRYPTRQEIDEGQAVAALNQKAARVYFGDRPPVSKTLYDGKRTVTVVGIVEHALFTSQWRQDFAQIYFPIRFKERPRRLFLVQTEGRPDRVATAVGAALKRDVPGALLVRAESMDEALALGEPTARFNATLFGVAGGAALLLVVVGVGGLVATNVSSRVRELGIRTALGAKPAQLIRLVVGAQIRRVVLGLALGLVCSWWTTKLVRAYRYDAHDARVWAVATLIILAAAIIAAWLPARRASRVNAVVALRAE